MNYSIRVMFLTCMRQVYVQRWFTISLCLLLCQINLGMAVGQQAGILSEIHDSVINPGFEKLIEEMPQLASGGVCSFVEDKQWLIVATGRAFLVREDGGSVNEGTALKIGKEKANKRLAETLSGYKVNGIETSQVRSKDADGIKVIERVVTSMTERSTSAHLANPETVGHWKINDPADALVVMIAIGSPAHPLLSNESSRKMKLLDAHWEGEWEKIFLKRPAILDGGASLITVNGELFILGVGRVNLTKVPSDEKKQKQIAEIEVLRHVSSLIDGISVKSTVKVESVFRDLSTEEQVLFSSVKENLVTKTWSRVRGAVRVKPEVGRWKSEDEHYLCFAYVFSLTDFIKY